MLRRCNSKTNTNPTRPYHLQVSSEDLASHKPSTTGKPPSIFHWGGLSREREHYC